ncbi:MarR family winged helix-turn-helix transcriptional regulator [Deinococcus humi]|uniref:DNA-binding MarR family transcriptional regulator n=1 Tax=Deinococcus humi TaxID=662880 RepID=A0A7W8NFV8_9DEIO|nr:MarR family transcriptional regulator [Deinococcus humi]MBB5365864.1 DNA-binding MarR family transcriptional regulator [Deinococcus humi]GGO38873.1 MarR family transcriptional regulator [Deinococcus humi]
MTSLLDELQQRRPFRSREEEAALNLFRTVSLIEEVTSDFLRQHDLTSSQYNVLRILRGAGEAGLGRNEIGERMIKRAPDITRLLDRMEAAGLVHRQRSTTDRRCVPTVLTDKGRALVDALDEPNAAMQHAQFGHLSEGQLLTLIETLTQIREGMACI